MTQEEFSINTFDEMIKKCNSKDLDIVKLYLEDIAKYPILTVEEEIDLVLKIKEGNQAAKDKLINSNLKLVVSIAKHYVGYGVEFMDLIQDGNCGLIKAIDRFDVSKGFKFSTYATWWIKQFIIRGLYDKGNAIRIPVHRCEEISKVRRAVEVLIKELGRFPKPNEIIDYMKTSDEYKSFLETVSEDKIEEILLDMQKKDIISLNTKITDDENSLEMIQTLEDNNCDVQLEIDAIGLRDELEELMENLSERERYILIKRFGFENGKILTLDELAEEVGVTRERVRQIELRAIKKIKFKAIKSELPVYLDDPDFMEKEKELRYL